MAYFLAIFFLSIASLNAKDLGNYGTLFKITEEDLLMILNERLSKATIDEHKQEEIQKAFVKSIETPKGKTLPQAIKQRSFDFDPTIYLHEDLKDKEGKIILAKGSKVNPLDNTQLRENLLFFDGNDPQQLAWAKSQKGKWILAAGRPIDLEKKEQRAVFFDQGGYLMNILGIQALPAKVTQEAKKLKVEEVPCF